MTHFADVEQFKIVSNFTTFRQVKIDPTNLFLLTLGRSQLLYCIWTSCSVKKQWKPSLFDKKFKNHS